MKNLCFWKKEFENIIKLNPVELEPRSDKNETETNFLHLVPNPKTEIFVYQLKFFEHREH